METKHTPGPWRYEAGTKTIRAARENYWLCSMDSFDGAVDHEANARLIAAAPELLAACEDLVNLWDEWVRYSEGLEEPLRRSIEMRVQQSRAAISKAKGE